MKKRIKLTQGQYDTLRIISGPHNSCDYDGRSYAALERKGIAVGGLCNAKGPTRRGDAIYASMMGYTDEYDIVIE